MEQYVYAFLIIVSTIFVKLLKDPPSFHGIIQDWNDTPYSKML